MFLLSFLTLIINIIISNGIEIVNNDNITSTTLQPSIQTTEFYPKSTVFPSTTNITINNINENEVPNTFWEKHEQLKKALIACLIIILCCIGITTIYCIIKSCKLSNSVNDSNNDDRNWETESMLRSESADKKSPTKTKLRDWY